jgi:hypothetical protein
MDPAGRNKILSRRRGRKPEEKRFKNTLEEENGAKKTANSNRQDQDISITPLGPWYIVPGKEDEIGLQLFYDFN